MLIRQFLQFPQPQGPYTITGSPGANPVAPGPSFSTQPAFSWPRVKGSLIGRFGAGLSIRWRSERQAPAPPTFTRICPGPGSGTGTSRSSGGFCQATSWNALTLASSVDNPVDIDHDVPWSAEYLVMPVRRRVGHEPRIPYPANELADRHLRLQSRKPAAETEMDAAAIAEVLVVLAFEIDLVWVREPARVAVARSIYHNDRGALWNGRSRNLDVFEGGAGGPELDRRLETQELLDPRHDQ